VPDFASLANAQGKYGQAVSYGRINSDMLVPDGMDGQINSELFSK